MIKLIKGAFLTLSLALLAGCSSHYTHSNHGFVNTQDLVITVVGYGAPKTTYDSLAQRRLMAMRASEVDAYRKLAEQISGVDIFGTSSVNDFIAGNDTLRLKFNTYLQGAAIKHQEFHDDGLVSTTMALRVNKKDLQHMVRHEQESRTHGAGLVNGSIYY